MWSVKSTGSTPGATAAAQRRCVRKNDTLVEGWVEGGEIFVRIVGNLFFPTGKTPSNRPGAPQLSAPPLHQAAEQAASRHPRAKGQGKAATSAERGNETRGNVAFWDLGVWKDENLEKRNGPPKLTVTKDSAQDTFPMSTRNMSATCLREKCPSWAKALWVTLSLRSLKKRLQVTLRGRECYESDGSLSLCKLNEQVCALAGPGKTFHLKAWVYTSRPVQVSSLQWL